MPVKEKSRDDWFVSAEGDSNSETAVCAVAFPEGGPAAPERAHERRERALGRIVEASIDCDRSTWVRPARAARALRVTVPRLGQLVREGRLRPWRDENGVRYFDRVEILEYARSRKRGRHGVAANGRLAALVFEMFSNGAGLPEIVRETLLPPEEVRRLYNEWGRPLMLDEGNGPRRKANGASR